ncbi:hypothetical protein D3C85_1433310 [compost metagenome]
MVGAQLEQDLVHGRQNADIGHAIDKISSPRLGEANAGCQYVVQTEGDQETVESPKNTGTDVFGH